MSPNSCSDYVPGDFSQGIGGSDGCRSPLRGLQYDMAAICADDLWKTYRGGTQALGGVTFTVQPGEIFGFLGANGAGKTTTIKLLLGLMAPSAGRALIFGADPTLSTTRRQVGYLPEVANYYDFMNVVELLSFYGTLCDLPRARIRERTEQMLELVGLQDVRKRALKHYSKGMLQRAGIAQALLHDPDLLILDEPTTGLDPLGRLQVRDVMLSLRDQGKTVFFSSHELSEAEIICDRVGILNAGVLSWCGATKDVAGDGAGNLERIFLRILGAGEKPAQAQD